MMSWSSGRKCGSYSMSNIRNIKDYVGLFEYIEKDAGKRGI